ncbi:dTDP-4-amino-4,6-dideoxy-D-galactose acyltransferase [Xenorhabdus nematophila]|uniref:dTDP-4-amino-4,6-dideoxy-D-galactose acyltransferase n=1 Tax=Xenorhabdus nematophila TaxID=628 RepID=UPI0003275BF1|nr:dTDP-4-amino-4,6-dideoxy-D-galactose acyltransferase [Xenorhabdus nematophila]CEE90139.1 putative acyl-CoA N-acyltransferase, lipopolysaccharide biosynthesis protein [Xenorhabdus nematophila str. Anatoliense]CEF31637.1 putative acyl-CoA N-acyltransferase, lipopolysaccharide biosynthesis protein [Xenorhabdus nematophila str. Websteri]AYA41400.1 dTDP-4-amino-4,6-dideoxy-D-galactose acyltransferase [Xenorhabdus nematophila]MBA0020138.1 dTDP-4-amino-4,6-dideoxy-D-galactose acyltransferase [Xenor
MSIHANLEPLAWDSQFFGLSTARLNLSPGAAVITAAHLDEYALVQAKIPAQQTAVLDALSALGFSLAEGEADLLLSLDAGDQTEIQTGQNAVPKFVIAKPQDIPALKAVAEQVFKVSRFRAPWYQPDDSGRFYAVWVENAVLGTFDHECLMINDEHGQMMGFVTLRDIGSHEARIGLLATVPGSHHQGIGKKLMSAAQQWCQQHQIQRLRIATQISNIAALRLYTRRGAIIESTAYWLYRG